MESAGPVALQLEFDARVNFAMQQNDVPVVKLLRLVNRGADRLHDLEVVAWIDGGLSARWTARIERLDPGATFNFENVDLRLDGDALARQTERRRAALRAEVTSGGEPCGGASRPVDVLAFAEWGGLASLPEILAAFVVPNDPAIDALLGEAAALLRTETGDSALAGYRARDPARARAVVAAIWLAAQRRQLGYVNPPASFEREGQKVRFPGQVLGHRLGTCLDLALLLAAAFEQAGLHPLLVLTRGHARAGVWLIDEPFAEPVIDDGLRLVKRAHLGEMLLLEATALTAARPVGLAASAQGALAALERDPGEFECAIDVRAARRQRIRPLPVPGADGTPAAPAAGTAGLAAEAAARERARPPGDAPVPAPDDDGRLGRWRRKLLDLSQRNRLLNFRPTRKSVELLCPSLPELQDALAGGKPFLCRPRPKLLDDSPRDVGVHRDRTGADAVAEMLREELGDRRLRSPLGADELDRRLVEVYRAARLGMEETGANTLFLALGFLRYFEAPASEIERRAPILLLPLRIERPSARDAVRLRIDDDEPRVNATLVEYLATEFGLRVEGLEPLPEDDRGVDVAAVLNAFRRAIRDVARWDVVEEAWVGLFSFTKFLMWRDLRDRAESLLENAVLRHLVEGAKEAFDGGGELQRHERLDEELAPAATFCPLDADSSQLAAVVSGAGGRSFVLEGPPGTGKSQTITNLIAQCLAKGQRVLFVAEKRAALEVVQRRLAQVGLAPFCLELHSGKASKRDVIRQLDETFEVVGAREPGEWQARAAALADERRALNRYVEAIHRPRAIGGSVFGVTARLIALRAAPRVPLDIDPAALDRALVEDLGTTADRLRVAVGAVAPVAAHVLAGIRRGEWSAGAPDALRERAHGVLDVMAALCERRAALGGTLAAAVDDRASRALLDRLGVLAELLIAAPGPPAAALTEPGWLEIAAVMRAVIERGRRRDALRADVFAAFDRRLLELDLNELVGRLRRAAGSWPVVSWLRALGPRRALRAVATRGLPASAALVATLEAAVELRELTVELASANCEGHRWFGGHWRDGESDFDALDAMIDWCGRLRAELAGLDLGDRDATARCRERCVELATTARDELGPGGAAGGVLRAWLGGLDGWRDARAALADAFDVDEPAAFGGEDEAGALPRMRERLERWRDGGGQLLRDWCHWRHVRGEAMFAGLAGLVTGVEDGSLEAGTVAAACERSVLELWLNATTDAEPLLRRFNSGEHERRIERFRALDRELIGLGREVVRARLAAAVPPRHGSASAASEIGILERQVKLKRRHMPVRRLFRELPELLPRLKPCLLMSPLSVAQYLDVDFPPFDVVVFDEASQIPAWDAVSAIARGRSVIVVGDSKQLPPTAFFVRGGDDDEEDADGDVEVEELESILDECVAAGLPSQRLLWHYRSRHETLIAFSNYHYYRNGLLTFPSPADRGPTMGVSLRAVPDGVYDRSRSRTNRAEAEAVVAELARRLAGADPPSLGVVTFSGAQQRLIEELLDRLRRDHPELEPFFADDRDEPVFVKNLENVQGDERDVVLFSVCYGPDQAGKVTMHFGPLNRDGGERRLNVAITRAREQVVVFATLRPDQIDLARTRALGVAHLRAFLDYADRGPQAIAEAVTLDGAAEYESPFERAVGEALRARGHLVDLQVGCSGYRIDLAVRDPERPGRYLLGVECDGAFYHSAATARDRDRLRAAVLARLGWRLHRVWSTDWWLRPERELERIEEAIAAAAREPVGEEPVAEESAAEEPVRYAAPPAAVAEAVAEDAGHSPGRRRDYRPSAAAERLGTADDFTDPRQRRQVLRVLLEVLAAEAPITEELALRRVTARWDLRVTARVRAWFERVVADAEAGGALRAADGILWSPDQDPAGYEFYRVPVPGDDSRRLHDVPRAELVNAVRDVLEAQVALPQTDLVREVARLFGASRVSARTAEIVGAAIEAAIEGGDAVRRDERVALPR